MKEKVFLHSCCGPCSTVCITRLKENYDVTVFYFNPNIYPREEYEKRKENQKIVCEKLGVSFVDGDYDENLWLDFVRGLEGEKEGGARCEKCFYFRLKETARVAKALGYQKFATTLSVSPHKNTFVINKAGSLASQEENIDFLEENFKKKDGYLQSIRLSKDFGLYRQNYCGCRFSIRSED